VSKIVVENVSKQFRLQADRPTSVKEIFTRRGRDKSADRYWALKDVSLEIPEGSMYALVGHNGSGKSTLLRCIAGIYQPNSGRVRVHGRISTLLELGAGFHPDLSGRENIYMNATMLGMSKKAIERVFDDIVAFAGVEIERFIDSPVKVYSTGMYVRLGFSVAVHVQPEILIIDEVIAVGDEEFQRRCFDHLYSLRKQGVTIVVVTHGLNLVETMCDSATWLDHGEVQVSGPAAEVTSEYLRVVNDRETDRRTAAAVDPADASDPWRQGFGKLIAIDGIYYTDGDGRPVKYAQSGAPLTINIVYEASQPVEDPVFGYMLHSENGAQLAGTNTKLRGFETGTIAGRGVVSFAIDELPLHPGHFDLTIGINDRHVQHVFDRHDRAYELIVRRGDRRPGAGLIDIAGRWSAPDAVSLGDGAPSEITPPALRR
jgi:ABC-2 type transport system ATP-binding protein/lipopolysaccharide transport system ATP-binding protein